MVVGAESSRTKTVDRECGRSLTRSMHEMVKDADLKWEQPASNRS